MDVAEGRDYLETQVRVSIVIPTFNMSQLIRETFASVLKQTFENFDVIVVDNRDQAQRLINCIKRDPMSILSNECCLSRNHQ